MWFEFKSESVFGLKICKINFSQSIRSKSKFCCQAQPSQTSSSAGWLRQQSLLDPTEPSRADTTQNSSNWQYQSVICNIQRRQGLKTMFGNSINHPPSLFEVLFIFEFVFIFEAVFIFEVIFIFEVVLILRLSSFFGSPSF